MKTYCNVCNKSRNFRNSKISYIFKKQVFTLFSVSVIMNIKKYLEKKNQYISQEYRLKNIDEKRNFFIEKKNSK